MGTQVATNQVKGDQWRALAEFGTVTAGGDITTALNAAIDDLTCAKLILPQGSYVISSTISIDRDITIMGAGSCAGGTLAERTTPGGATGNPGESSTRFTFTGASGACFDIVGSGTEGLENVHLSDFMVTGNATARCGLLIGSTGTVSKSTFRNLFFEDFTSTTADHGNGLQIRQTVFTQFENVYIHGCNDGINVYGNSTSIRFYNVVSRVNARYGMLWQQGNGNHFGNLGLEGNSSSALAIIPKAGAECGSSTFGPGMYVEANNQGTPGAAGDGYSIYIKGGSDIGKCRDNKFQDLACYDNIGGNTTRLIYLDMCDYIHFKGTVLSTIASGFAECTSNTVDCLIQTRGGLSVNPSNITGNGFDSSGVPRVTLDEESPRMGTWTPTADSGITISGLGSNRWIRNGNSIRCHFEINVTAISSTTVTLGGLPFAANEQTVNGSCSTPGGLVLAYITPQTDSTVILIFDTTWSGSAVTMRGSFEYYI